MTKKSSKNRTASSNVEKCDTSSCCCGLNLTFWPVMFIVVGIVWMIEHYIKTDIPLVAVGILLVGLFMLFKKDKK